MHTWDLPPAGAAGLEKAGAGGELEEAEPEYAGTGDELEEAEPELWGVDDEAAPPLPDD